MRIHRDDFLIKAVKAALVFLNDLRLKVPIAVSRNRQFYFVVTADYFFATVPIAAVFFLGFILILGKKQFR